MYTVSVSEARGVCSYTCPRLNCNKMLYVLQHNTWSADSHDKM